MEPQPRAHHPRTLGLTPTVSGTLTRRSVASQPDEPSGLTVLPPEEALRRALPAPTAEELEIEGLTDEEWTAFEQALASR